MSDGGDAFHDAFRDLLGDPDVELDMAEVFTPPVLRRMARMAQQPSAVAKIQECQREEVARQIVKLLAVRDEAGARLAIEDAQDLYGADEADGAALTAEVERLAREAALKAEPDPWQGDPVPE